jgi:hypothetical protein
MKSQKLSTTEKLKWYGLLAASVESGAHEKTPVDEAEFILKTAVVLVFTMLMVGLCDGFGSDAVSEKERVSPAQTLAV